MIDIHCHILPMVDDGADSLEEALEMARMAADSGVSAIIATPHCNLPLEEEKNYASPALTRAFSRLRTAIEEAGIPIDLRPGAEVLCTPQVPELIQSGMLPTLAQSRYLLLEFFFDEDLEYMDEMLRAVAAQDCVPVIAHPERYEAIQRAPYLVERWFRAGYVIQLNPGSILGRLGRRAAETAEWLLDHGLAHVVASDAHSPNLRTPRMGELTDYLHRFWGREYTHVLLRENPGRILSDRPILKAD